MQDIFIQLNISGYTTREIVGYILLYTLIYFSVISMAVYLFYAVSKGGHEDD